MGRLSGGFGGLTAQSRQRTQPDSMGRRLSGGFGRSPMRGDAMGSFWDRWSEWRSARQRPQLPQRWGSRFGMLGGLGGYGMNSYADSQARPIQQLADAVYTNTPTAQPNPGYPFITNRSYGADMADRMQLPQQQQPINKYLTSFNTPTAQPNPGNPFITNR